MSGVIVSHVVPIAPLPLFARIAPAGAVVLKGAVTDKQEAYVFGLVEGFVRRTCVCGCVWMDEWVGGYIYL
jgi:hypothetical protein